MRKAFIAAVFINLIMIYSSAMAACCVDQTWQCSQWTVSDVGRASCSLVEEGCKVHIEGKPYTLYSVVKFPGKARYFQEWDVELDSRLEQGALGIAIGNERTGLIFQVSDRNVAEVLFYSESQTIKPKLSKSFRAKSKDFLLRLNYDSNEGHCIFRVNDEKIFDFYPGKISGLPMTSNVKQVAVTTTLPKGRKSAQALHKTVKVQAH